MKKRLLSIFAMAIVALSASAAVGDDLTSKYLTNADFTADTPLHYGVCTYAKDAAAAGTTLSGMQPVVGWTASNPYIEGGENVDARACGVFELGKQYVSDYTGLDEDMTTPIFLGGTGFITPAPTEGLAEGNVLGMVGVWGATVQYTQEVVLAAGVYAIQIPVYNSGGVTAVDGNLFGFIAEDGTKYVASQTTWTVGAWEAMTINFKLDAETKGVFSLGYKAAGAGSAAMPHLYMGPVKILEGDSGAIDKEEADKLRPELAELIEAAEELSVDYSAEKAVYDDESATAAQVQAAIDSLKEKNANAMTDFTDYFINNAHFALGTPMDNGVCTYDYDMEKNSTTYYGMQPIQDWTASNPSTNTVEGVNNGRASGLFAVGSESTIWLGSQGDVVPATKASGATEGNLFGFISVWSGSASYTQNVTLPAGSYTITIPTYNERGTGAVAKNLCGFIADDGTEYLAATTTFTVGKWSNETIKFKLEEETSGVITIGYQAANAGSGSMPHLFIDEFTLMFNGKTDVAPSLIALNGAIRTGENYLDSEDPYYSELKDALQDAVDAGVELKNASSADDAANTAAATAISNLVADVRASQSTYKTFYEFIEGTLTDAIDKYDQSEDLADFAGELSDSKDEYTSAYEEGTYTTDQINEIINGFSARVQAAVQTAFDKAVAEGGEHNIDISCLIKSNIDFANKSTADWTCTKTSGKFESQQNGVIEVWSASAVTFDASTTLTDLPDGAYKIVVPGFYRNGAIADNYAAYTGGEEITPAYLYAGGSKTLLHNQAEMASDTQDDLHNGTAAEGAYLPNGQAAAQTIFYGTTDYDMTNSVVGAAVNGKLTFGCKATDLVDGGSWVCWGAATVIYLGDAGYVDALYAQMQQLVETAQNMLDDASAVAEADNELNEALSAAESTSDTDKDEIIATINQLQSAIDYANQAAAAVEEITEVYTLYNDYLVPAWESEDENFITLLEQIGTCLEDGFENIEQIQSLEDQIPAAYGAWVQYNYKGATEQNPGDISAAIINRGFEGAMNDQTVASGSGNGEYWTKSRVGGNDFGYQAGVYESWNTDTFDIHQTIQGLQAGYYRIRVQSFFRANTDNQTNADEYAADTTKCAAYLYANAAMKQIRNQVDRGDAGEMVGTDGNETAITYGESTEYYVPTNRTGCAAYFDADLYWNELDCQVGTDGILTLGIKKESHVYGDWCPFDNFQLLYLGTTAPTAVESIEAETPAAAGKIYDLSGRQVSRAQRGIYIVNGKKVIK